MEYTSKMKMINNRVQMMFYLSEELRNKFVDLTYRNEMDASTCLRQLIQDFIKKEEASKNLTPK